MAQAGELRDISRSHLPDGSMAGSQQRFSLRQLSLDDQTFGTTGACLHQGRDRGCHYKPTQNSQPDENEVA